MTSPKESLPHFLRAVTQTGMNPDLFVYVSSLINELRWNHKDEGIFKLQAGGDGKIGVFAPDGESCVFSGLQADLSGRWQAMELVWSGHADTFSNVQQREVEDAAIEQFYMWCADHCPLGYSVALDIVEIQSRQALDQTRKSRDANQRRPDPEGSAPWI